jgi:hypothetical protein
MQVNTTAIHSAPNCVTPDILPSGKRVDLVKVDATGTWENSAVYQGCNFTWTVKKEAVDLFGLDVLGNPNSSASSSTGEGCVKFKERPAEHQPVALWFFTYQTTPPSASITICEPTIELWKVTAEISLTNGNLTKVTRREALSAGEAGAASIANITGAPMEGRAYNGVAFNTGQFAKGDPFVLRRAEATTLQLPAAVVQAARTSSQGFLPTFLNDQFVHLSSAVYVGCFELRTMHVARLLTSFVIHRRCICKTLRRRCTSSLRTLLWVLKLMHGGFGSGSGTILVRSTDNSYTS